MTVENDFQAFATGVNANVESQSAYVADTPTLQNGFTSGIANSGKLNKVWRQSSIMSAVLAQFIVNQTGQPAIDDGTTATLLANLSTAVGVAARQNPVLPDTGAANAYVVANLSAFTAYPTVSGLTIDVSILNANTGASTLNVDGLGAKPILGLGLQPLQGGELIVKGVACLLYIVASTVNSGNGAWVLTECAGGAQQVAPAVAPTHAVQFGQVAGVVGSVRNLKANVSSGATAMTLTADEIICETALGGLRYCVANVNQTLNLATIGAGGMDVGVATANGFLGVYEINGPSVAPKLYGTMEGASPLTSVYSGATGLPAGYTASSLVAVLPISATTGQLSQASIVDRTVYIQRKR